MFEIFMFIIGFNFCDFWCEGWVKICFSNGVVNKVVDLNIFFCFLKLNGFNRFNIIFDKL